MATNSAMLSPSFERLRKNLVLERRKDFERMVSADVSEDFKFPFENSPLYMKPSISKTSKMSSASEADTLSDSTTSTTDRFFDRVRRNFMSNNNNNNNAHVDNDSRRKTFKSKGGDKSVKSYRVQHLLKQNSSASSETDSATPDKPVRYTEPSSTRAYTTKPLPGEQCGPKQINRWGEMARKGQNGEETHLLFMFL